MKEDGGNGGNADGGWWRTANLGECPITLECFSTLEYPPFALYHPGKTPSNPSTDHGANSDSVSSYFDGLALASYIVSRGVFQNPLTRIELTAEDCRRLDRYLEEHCYRSDAATAKTIFRGSRMISVAEAFALRNSVSVESTTTNNANNNERDRDRIRVLQNAATAALAGLFVFGNDRRRHTHTGNEEITQQVPQLRNETSVLLNDWGFDLSRQVEDPTSAQSTHGYLVVDDDEEVAVASQRHAYETVQEAFPRLSSDAASKRDTRGNEANRGVVVDEQLMERIRDLSARDEDEQRKHARELEKAREELLRQALERRKQRQKDREARRAQDAKNYLSQKKDEAELERARLEIEAWRDDQWEKLRLLSEHEERQRKETARKNNSTSGLHSGEQFQNSHKDDGGDKGEVEAQEADRNAMAEEKKKAKAAAKRKRAKERKKAKKALEKQEEEKIRLREAEKARRAASALKCGACGTGILKPSLAFERFDQLFCSPKCARTAVKPVSG